MTYLQFHLLFLLPPLVVAGLLLARRRAEVPPLGYIPLLALIAFVYTTPWDNYLVATGIWSYGPDRVAATIGYVPVEEYLFFLLQPVLTGSVLYLSFTRAAARSEPNRALFAGGIALYAALTVMGIVGLMTSSGRYAGLILAWAAPVALGQWILGWRAIWRWRGAALPALALSTIYLWIADAVAIDSGIWHIAEDTTTGLGLGPLPMEEALFFLMTNVLVVQGLLLFVPREADAVRPASTAEGELNGAPL